MAQQSGEKTEKATPKKRRDVREKGNILKSNDMSNAFMLFIFFGILKIFGSGMALSFQKNIVNYLNGSHMLENIAKDDATKLMADVFVQIVQILAPLFMLGCVGAVVVNLVQTRFYFSTKTLGVKMDKINPIQGLKRIISVRSVVEMLKALLKVVLMTVVLYQEVEKSFKKLPSMMMLDIKQSWSLIAELTLAIAFKASLALLVLAVMDYLFQWWQYEKDLKMTKQEVKDEYKQIEGNQEVKGFIKQKQRQMSMLRTMQAVPKADVIITNPTHYAIALKYDEKLYSAPIVIAKGKDYLAQKIKEIAKQKGIEMVENRPLAQSLYINCDVGEQIPEELYKAVAEILAHVFKMKRRKDGGKGI